MRRLIPCVTAGTLMLALATASEAQEFATAPVFTFAPAPGPDQVDDANKELKAKENLTIRPNQAGEFYLYAKNPTDNEDTFLIEARGGPGSRFAGQAKVTIPAGKWVRVRLQKPAPAAPAVPAVVPPPPPPAAPGTPPPPAPEPPPPGDELNRGKNGFAFTLRLLDKDGKAVVDAKDRPYGREVGVRVERPKDYIKAPVGVLNQTGAFTAVEFTVEPDTAADGTPKFAGSAPVVLGFPPQPALAGATVREGFYRRTLVVEPGAKLLPAATLAGTIEKAGTGLILGIGVDGYERAFTYRPNVGQDATAAKLTPDPTRAVRVYPAAWPAPAKATRPVAAYPVRVEADNDTPASSLELWVQPAAATDATRREVVKLGATRDERVWADAAGPNDGGVLVSSRLKDWAKAVDLSAVRGDCEIVAVMRDGGSEIKSDPLRVRIDDTAPRFIDFGDVQEKLVKGQPLTVSATAEDSESDVVSAVFFVGKPLDDGKVPPGAPTVEAVVTPGKAANQWLASAQIPLPPDKRGDVIVGVVFVNDAGIATTKTQKVQLVDAPPPLGTVRGVVLLGERPQPKLVVNLFDDKGVVKGTATTDEYGRFKFVNVVPGNYAVASSKKDSSYGTSGSTPVEVKADPPEPTPAPKPDPKAKKPDPRPQDAVAVTLTRMPR